MSSVAAAAPDALCMLCRSSVACMGVDVVRGPRGERNRNFKQDRYTCETKELLAIAPAVRSKRFWPRSSCVDSRRQTHKMCSR